MPYAHLADVVVVIHMAFVVFVAAGGFLARRHPLVLPAHMLAVGWAVGIVAVGWACPLTALEKFLLARAGLVVYDGGFVDRYVTGVLYPPTYEPVVQLLLAAGVIASYVGLRPHHRRPVGPER